MSTLNEAMTTPNYDYETLRTKFLTLAKKKGTNTAISELHREINKLEIHVFDGGYEKDRLMIVQKLRELSREIWTTQFQIT